MLSTGLGLIGSVLGLTEIKKESETVQLFKANGGIIRGLEIRLNVIQHHEYEYWEASGPIGQNWPSNWPSDRNGKISGMFDIDHCLPSYAEMVIDAFKKTEQVKFVFGYEGTGTAYSGYGYITSLEYTIDYEGTLCLSGSLESVGAVTKSMIV